MFNIKSKKQSHIDEPKKVNEATEIRKRSFPTYIAIGLVGAVIIFICLKYENPLEHNHWLELSIHIGQALIIGSTISLLIDLPAMVNYFKKITIQSLISEDYLNSLSRIKLLDLRKKTTARIHLKDTQFVEHGLIDLDEKICDLLTKYYHERYRQNVSCKFEGDYVIKKHHVEELIINPLGNTGNSIKFPENVRNFFYKKENENVGDMFKILKYVVTADDKKEIDYMKEGIKIIESPSDTTDMPYNVQTSIVNKDNNPLEFEFIKWLKIEKIWEVRVPKADITFLKRVKIPVKSFRLDYHFPDSGVKLVAACFGTLALSDEGNIKIIHEDDHVSIESYTWLLPGNGAYVVTI